ncbi:hypothetical protein SAMN04488168_10942 [Bacillus sp. 491mf]|nr:hypothetical protein SAMN04488168_10942 [Bacillus sp. 491mf]
MTDILTLLALFFILYELIKTKNELKFLETI